MSKRVVPLRAVSLTVRIIAVLLTLVFIGQQVAVHKTLTFTIGDAGHNVGVIFAFWLRMLPPGFCLAALWETSNVFARLGRGDAFGRAMVKGLRGIGLNLVLSALAAIVISPSLQPVFLGQGWSVVFNLDIESVTVGLIGLMMYVMAWQGSAMKAELEQFV